jgi:Zn-dependent protease with chaperone function/tellurite resistance protein
MNLVSFGKVLAATVAIPFVGLLVSRWIIGATNSDLAADGLPPYEEICAITQALEIPEVRSACAEFASLELLGHVSIVAALLGVAIPVVFVLLSFIAGQSRRRLAAIFPPLLALTTIAISVSVLLQGGILTYAAYVGESYAIGRVHLFIIGAVGVGAFIAAIRLIGALFSFWRKQSTSVVGKSLPRNAARSLYTFVEQLASKLGAQSPKNIVVGLEPNFFVTNCDVTVVGEHTPLSGETLYVSAPLMRLMTRDEMAAVIGHELGHFRGADTVYSLKFAPVYSGFASAIRAVIDDESEGASSLAKLPAALVLSFMFDVFSRNERTIGRRRELEADKAGAEAASPHALATALVKVSLFVGLWTVARQQNIERLNRRKVSRNLSRVFEDKVRYDIEHESLEHILEQVRKNRLSHPTDTHPTTGERLNSLGIGSGQIGKDDLSAPQSSAIELLDNHVAIEEELTSLEHRLMVALGHVERLKDDETREQDGLLNIVYSLAAAMITADGRIDPKEIEVAERIGTQLLPKFDPVDFRECCAHPAELPEIKALVEVLEQALTREGKEMTLSYLEALSSADGKADENELQLLREIAEVWNLDQNNSPISRAP